MITADNLVKLAFLKYMRRFEECPRPESNRHDTMYRGILSPEKCADISAVTKVRDNYVTIRMVG